MASGDIWITGGAGFFGRAIAAQLGSRARVTRRAEVDLLDLEATCRFVEGGGFDGVVHAAGFVGGIGLNQAHPGRMASENLRMGLNLLEAAARRRGLHVVIVSTVCVYPEAAPIPTPETAMFDGFPSEVTSFYGLAKRMLLTVAEGLRRESGLSYTYLVPTNLYGPGDHFEEEKSHVVPALIQRAVAARDQGAGELVVWGDGSQTRDLLYVEDGARGVEKALDRARSGGVYNLSSGRETSIRELAETICRLVGFAGRLVWDPTKPGGAPRRALDPGKARRELGFAATTGLEDGLRRTISWYADTKSYP
jgi:GDP-L-fucose synthase